MNVGVVGLGYWGSKVYEEYRSLREEKEIDSVVAIDSDQKALDGVKMADEKYESVSAAMDAVDALHVATSNESHFPIAKMAIEQERDVLLEKPLTVNREKGFDLVQLASEKGCILQTGHIFRFANVIREIKNRYEEGYFGSVNHFTLRWTHDFEPTGATDVTWDLLPHPIDILNFITSKWPSDFSGVANRRNEDGCLTAAHLTFSIGDINGIIQVSWEDKKRRRTLEIAGDQRSATVDCVDQDIHITDGGSESKISSKANNTIRAEALNFIKAASTGKNTYNSAVVGARTVESIERAIKAIRYE